MESGAVPGKNANPMGKILSWQDPQTVHWCSGTGTHLFDILMDNHLCEITSWFGHDVLLFVETFVFFFCDAWPCCCSWIYYDFQSRTGEELKLRTPCEGHRLGVVSVDINKSATMAVSSSLDSQVIDPFFFLSLTYIRSYQTEVVSKKLVMTW